MRTETGWGEHYCKGISKVTEKLESVFREFMGDDELYEGKLKTSDLTYWEMPQQTPVSPEEKGIFRHF